MRILLWSALGVAGLFLAVTFYPLPRKPVAGFIVDPSASVDPELESAE